MQPFELTGFGCDYTCTILQSISLHTLRYFELIEHLVLWTFLQNFKDYLIRGHVWLQQRGTTKMESFGRFFFRHPFPR